MPHWYFGCISIGFDVRVGYVSMGHILSAMGHILLSPHAIQFLRNALFQFVPLILVNYNIPRMTTRIARQSGTEFSHILYNASVVFEDTSRGSWKCEPYCDFFGMGQMG